MLLRVEKSHWIWHQEASATLARVVSVVAGGVDGGAAVGQREEEPGGGGTGHPFRRVLRCLL